MGVQESEPPTENVQKNSPVIESEPVEVTDFIVK
jgi:hypothetical protein